jgi:hypothetical protein
MQERRRLQRFDLPLPTTIEILGAKPDVTGTPLDSLTRDVSSGGAFFLTCDPLPVGTRVMAEMVLKAENLGLSSGYPQVKATGYVVRAELSGMAVRFNGRCRFVPSESIREDDRFAEVAAR